MENTLKKVDGVLYLLAQEKGNKAYQQIDKLLRMYKMDDEVLTELIKELRNKVIQALPYKYTNGWQIEKYHRLIMRATNKLEDSTDICNSLMECDDALDLLILLEILYERTIKKSKKEDSSKLIKDMVSSGKSKELIDKYLLKQEIVIENYQVQHQFEKLLELLVSTKDTSHVDMVKEMLYSARINEIMDVKSIINAANFISSTLNKTTETIIEELALNHIKSQPILLGLRDYLKNSKNSSLNMKAEVAEMYMEIYRQLGVAGNFKINEDIETILRNHSDEAIQAFIDSLPSTCFHKTTFHPQKDLVTILLSMDKPEIALSLFEKSRYKPIDKTKRKKEINDNKSSDFVDEKFAKRLDGALGACIETCNYEALLRILGNKKVDSIAINPLHHVLVGITNKGAKHIGDRLRFCNSKLREEIESTIRTKISEGKLMVYRTSRNWNDKHQGFIYDIDRAKDFVSITLQNPTKRVGEVMNEVKVKTKTT